MVKYIGIGLVLGVFGWFATPVHACDGASCGMPGMGGTTRTANVSRGTNGSGMMMRGGGGGQSGGSRGAGAKQAGNYGR